MRSIFQLLLLLSLATAGVSAQTTPPDEVKVSPSTDQNIRTPIEAPQAVFPVSGKLDNISGSVMVKVLIDETGKVTSAGVVSGLEQKDFRDSAIAAAMKARFHPWRKDGKSVKVYRTLEYTFALEDDKGFEKIKLFAMGVGIEVMKVFADDPGLLAKDFGGPEAFSEMKDDPDHGKHFVELARFAYLTPEERRVEADKAYSSLKTSLNTKEQWDLEAGRHVGTVFGPIVLLREQKAGPEKMMLAFGEAKSKLAGLSDWVKSPPKEVDPLLLSRLKVLVESTTTGKSPEEDMALMIKAIDGLMNTY